MAEYFLVRLKIELRLLKVDFYLGQVGCGNISPEMFPSLVAQKVWPRTMFLSFSFFIFLSLKNFCFVLFCFIYWGIVHSISGGVDHCFPPGVRRFSGQ